MAIVLKGYHKDSWQIPTANAHRFWSILAARYVHFGDLWRQNYRNLQSVNWPELMKIANNSYAIINDMKGRSYGYTILEALIFLAVSGLLFAAVYPSFVGRDNKTKFSQAVRDLDTKINDIMNDTSLLVKEFQPVSAVARTIWYKVKKNETISKIAAKYGVSVSSIKKWNKLKKAYVAYGQKIKLIIAPPATAVSSCYTQAFANKIIEKKADTVRVDMAVVARLVNEKLNGK